jgi:ubiquitin-protein ligase
MMMMMDIVVTDPGTLSPVPGVSNANAEVSSLKRVLDNGDLTTNSVASEAGQSKRCKLATDGLVVVEKVPKVPALTLYSYSLPAAISLAGDATVNQLFCALAIQTECKQHQPEEMVCLHSNDGNQAAYLSACVCEEVHKVRSEIAANTAFSIAELLVKDKEVQQNTAVKCDLCKCLLLEKCVSCAHTESNTATTNDCSTTDDGNNNMATVNNDRNTTAADNNNAMSMDTDTSQATTAVVCPNICRGSCGHMYHAHCFAKHYAQSTECPTCTKKWHFTVPDTVNKDVSVYCLFPSLVCKPEDGENDCSSACSLESEISSSTVAATSDKYSLEKLLELQMRWRQAWDQMLNNGTIMQSTNSTKNSLSLSALAANTTTVHSNNNNRNNKDTSSNKSNAFILRINGKQAANYPLLSSQNWLDIEVAALSEDQSRTVIVSMCGKAHKKHVEQWQLVFVNDNSISASSSSSSFNGGSSGQSKFQLPISTQCTLFELQREVARQKHCLPEQIVFTTKGAEAAENNKDLEAEKVYSSLNHPGSALLLQVFPKLCNGATLSVKCNELRSAAMHLLVDVFDSRGSYVHTLFQIAADNSVSSPISSSLPKTLTPSVVLYANPRWIVPSSLALWVENTATTKPNTASVSSLGWQEVFAHCLAWHPSQSTQSPAAITTFLSCLYVLCSHLHKDSAKAKRVLGHFRKLTQNPPAVLALYLLIHRKAHLLQDSHKCILATAVYDLIHRWRSRSTTITGGTGNDNSNSSDGSQMQIDSQQDADKNNIDNNINNNNNNNVKMDPSRTLEATRFCFVYLVNEALVEHSATEVYQDQAEKVVWQFAENGGKTANSSESDDTSMMTIDDNNTNASDLLSTASVPVNASMTKSWKEIVRSSIADPSYFKLVAPLSLTKALDFSLTRDAQGMLVVFTGRGKDSVRCANLYSPLTGCEDSYSPQAIAEQLSKLQQQQQCNSSDSSAFNDLQEIESYIDDRSIVEAILVCVDTSQSMKGDADFEENSIEKQQEEQFAQQTKQKEPKLPTTRELVSSLLLENGWSTQAGLPLQESDIAALQDALTWLLGTAALLPIVQRIYAVLMDSSRYYSQGARAKKFKEGLLLYLYTRTPTKTSREIARVIAKYWIRMFAPLFSKEFAGNQVEFINSFVTEHCDARINRKWKSLAVASSSTTSTDSINNNNNSNNNATSSTDSISASSISVYSDEDEVESPEVPVPADLVCPIYGTVFQHPRCCEDGYTYEQTAIQAWFDRCPVQRKTSPMTGLPISTKLTPVYAIQSIADDWRRSAQQKLNEFYTRQREAIELHLKQTADPNQPYLTFTVETFTSADVYSTTTSNGSTNNSNSNSNATILPPNSVTTDNLFQPHHTSRDLYKWVRAVFRMTGQLSITTRASSLYCWFSNLAQQTLKMALRLESSSTDLNKADNHDNNSNNNMAFKLKVQKSYAAAEANDSTNAFFSSFNRKQESRIRVTILTNAGSGDRKVSAEEKIHFLCSTNETMETLKFRVWLYHLQKRENGEDGDADNFLFHLMYRRSRRADIDIDDGICAFSLWSSLTFSGDNWVTGHRCDSEQDRIQLCSYSQLYNCKDTLHSSYKKLKQSAKSSSSNSNNNNSSSDDSNIDSDNDDDTTSNTDGKPTMYLYLRDGQVKLDEEDTSLFEEEEEEEESESGVKGTKKKAGKSSSKKKKAVEQLTRLETCKQLFHAFINRSLAYDYPVHLGALQFGNRVQMQCQFTGLYEEFRNSIDEMVTHGDTALYAALQEGCNQLIRWKTQQLSKHPNMKLRIVCLSDGANTIDNVKAEAVTAQLQLHNVVVDVLQIGSAPSDLYLQGIAYATGGYYFAPKQLSSALQICEMETMICQTERPKQEPNRLGRVQSTWDLKRYIGAFGNNTWDVAAGKVPPRKSMYDSSLSVCALDQFLKLHNTDSSSSSINQSTTTTSSSSHTNNHTMRTRAKAVPVIVKTPTTVSNGIVSGQKNTNTSQMKRIMQEMQQLAANPHPAFDIYPQESDIAAWTLIVEGPATTPYADGCWKLHLVFPPEYPRVAPEIRFSPETPILHTNVNVHGRVCHSIFDRNYHSEISVKMLLECIYGLLLSPDVSDPLDSVLALQFYDGNGLYEYRILEHKKKYANKTRNQWQKQLLVSDNSTSSCAKTTRKNTNNRSTSNNTKNSKKNKSRKSNREIEID